MNALPGLLLLASALRAGGQEAPPPYINLAATRLELDGKVLQPIAKGTRWAAHEVFADRTVDVFEDALVVRNLQGEALFESEFEHPGPYRIGAAEDGVLYLLPVPQPQDDAERDLSQIERYDCRTGKWLMPLVPTTRSGGAKSVAETVAVRGNRIAALWSMVSKENRVVDGAVTVFGKEGPSQWSRTLSKPEGGAGFGKGFLLASRYPNFADSAIKGLTWAGDDLLVCSGPTDPILRLDGDKGTPRWNLPRIWEFQRSFTGPSVWSHSLTRFGIEKGESSEEDRKAERAFSDLFTGSIVGGPIWISNQKASPYAQEPGTFFVAVTLARKGVWEGYVGDCFVYQVDPEGRPMTRVPMPQYVLGDQFKVVEDGVVWATQNHGMIRMPTTQPRSFGGPGSDDLTGRVGWFRQATPVSPNQWLSTEPLGMQTAFGSRMAFRSDQGWYVSGPKALDATQPLTVVDLDSGTTRLAKLKLALNRPVPRPDKNQDQATVHLFRPYLFGVADLRLRGGILRITLADGKETVYADFRVGA